MCTDSSGTLRIEIMRYSTWQRGYLNISSSTGSSAIIQREEAHSFLRAPDMGQLWKVFCTNEANVASHRATKRQLLSQSQNQLYLNGDWKVAEFTECGIYSFVAVSWVLLLQVFLLIDKVDSMKTIRLTYKQLSLLMLLKWKFKETAAISIAVLESCTLAEHVGLSF